MLDLALSATNPCHLYSLAEAVAQQGEQVTFYSGYPRWRLRPPFSARMKTHSLRTCITYGLLRLPTAIRPSNRTLFLWQDRHFDHWASQQLGHHDFVHAMPGQAARTFSRAKSLNVRTVLNHATGPSIRWVDIMQREYDRVGLNLEKRTVYNSAYFKQEEKEYALADYHCVASTLVRDQLVDLGIPLAKIWLVGYGAEPNLFYRASAKTSGVFRILFAGNLSLRKGIRTLLHALELAGSPNWHLDFYGHVSEEAKTDIATYRGTVPVRFHGAVKQNVLAEAMRAASVLVLPSLEEGFGLVVVQALACGTPCLVSDRVGAGDLITQRENGSIFKVGDAAALADELKFWASQNIIVAGDYSWTGPALQLIAASRQAMAASNQAALSA
jgi:glycosyltransferase involved in cell wall biosynthesis